MNDNYSTDVRIMELFDNWFDPCTLSKGELRDFDGLGSNWKDKTFVNPPYSNPLKWVKKAIEENKKGKTIVMLLNMDCSTEWFKLLQENNAMFFWINGRLRFGGLKQPSNKPSMLVILNKCSVRDFSSNEGMELS